MDWRILPTPIPLAPSECRRRPFTVFCVALAALLPLAPARAADAAATIDSGRYADASAAQAAWRPMADTAPAQTTNVHGAAALLLRCNFAGTAIDRASWDRDLDLDLSEAGSIRFRLFCTDASPVSRFSLYLRSGAGWYAWAFYPAATGAWTTVELDKAQAHTEGRPEGWQHLRTLRVSAWRGGDADTAIALCDIAAGGVLGRDAAVAILRADSVAAREPGERASVQAFAEAVARGLRTLGIGSVTLSDLDITAARLRHADVVILPHNPDLPEAAVRALTAYLRQGGKLLTFYGLPRSLAPLVGIAPGAYVKADPPGRLAAMRFIPGVLPGAPAVATQRSWNILAHRPVPGASRAAAEWVDDQGRPAGYAAVVVSSNAVAMAHVLLPGDDANKQRLLLAMVGHLAPRLWEAAAGAALAGIGRVGGHDDFDDAVAELDARTAGDARAAAALEDARRLRREAMRLAATRRFTDACEKAWDARRRVLDAYYAAQRPLPDEFRAFWCHRAHGVDGLTWDETARRLAENGFTAVIANMLWGGVAFYPGSVLPAAPRAGAPADRLADCVAACRRHGLQVHVWKVNWNLGEAAPDDLVARLRREGRLQAGPGGEELLWLCPSHPANQDLERDAMLDVARRYDVDGLHFDYIRYPDADHCYCGGCRQRFQQDSGATVADWPRDVQAGGPRHAAWQDWRRANITALVRDVSAQARAIRPRIRISAAVFANWGTDRETVAQDWRLWCDRGYLDFVCPMDYTESPVQIENWVTRQKAWAGGVPCYPGIGASAVTPGLDAEDVIAQVLITRRLDTRGFTIFELDATAADELLPALGRGLTAPR